MSTYPVGTPAPASRTYTSQATVVFPTPDVPYSHSIGSAITMESIGTGKRPVERYSSLGSGHRSTLPGLAGYCSEANLEAAKERQLSRGTDTFMATGRLKHDEQVPPAPRGRIPKDATLKERMARKLRTQPGKAACSRRKATSNPSSGRA